MSSSIAVTARRSPVATREVTAELPSLRRRHPRRIGRLLSLLLVVALPTALIAGYLYYDADDQYVSEFRFNVRHQAPLRVDPSSGSAIAAPAGGMGGMANLAVITDSQIVVQYLKSQQIIEDILAAGVDLDAIYALQDRDFWAHLQPVAPIEERLRYWRRMVDPFFDMTNGIVSVQVRAFRPGDARLVAEKVLMLAERLVNTISERAHDDQLAYATREAASCLERLRRTQAEMAAYRNEHAVLFPEMQATAGSTVEGKVEESLIEAKTDYSTQLARGASPNAMLMLTLHSRIMALEAEQQRIHGGMAQADGASLASVMSGYSVLEADQQTAAKVYERALISLQDARNEAAQQSIYLAAFVRPGLPQDSEYPVRWRLLLEAAAISFVAWCLLQLTYHGIRDHID